MAKVVFRDLPLGVPAQTSDVWGNLDKVATALSGNIVADQMKSPRATFSVPCFFTRLTTSNQHKFAFACPPLQENFDSTHYNESETTPQVTLESVCISFDNVNARHPVLESTGLSSDTLTWDTDMEVLVQLGSGQIIARTTIPLSALDQENNDIVNRPNPTISAYVGATIPRYDWVYVYITSPNDDATGGVNSVLVHAVLSADVVERDTSAILDTYITGSGNIAQNAPAHNNARVSTSVSLTTPTDGTLIKATGTSGVQTSIETLDSVFLEGLGGPLDRWSKTDPNGEHCKHDSSYFVMAVPLFRNSEGAGFYTAAGSNSGYEIANSEIGGVSCFMDKAIIPITAPGCIHHVFCATGPVSTAGNYTLKATCGVALGSSIRTDNILYQQVAYRQDFNLTQLQSFNLQGYMMAQGIPIVYQTGTKLGKGFYTQGRPFFFGREIGKDPHGRNNCAAVSPASAEAAPKTLGMEQVLEVRMTINLYDNSAGSWVDIDTDTVNAGGALGSTVYIIGKQALVE